MSTIWQDDLEGHKAHDKNIMNSTTVKSPVCTIFNLSECDF